MHLIGREETRPYWSAKRTKDARVEQHLSQAAAHQVEPEPQYGHSREDAHKDEPSRLLTVSGGIGAKELRFSALDGGLMRLRRDPTPRRRARGRFRLCGSSYLAILRRTRVLALPRDRRRALRLPHPYRLQRKAHAVE